MKVNGRTIEPGADLRGVDLCDADLSGTNLREVDLSGADLSGADLRGADLRGAHLRSTDLSNADLRRANLHYASFYVANLHGANLCCANLYRADLSDADLSGADLSGANLHQADLRRADLRGADLSNSGFYALGVPEKGEYTAFKKAGAYVVELLIPADAARSTATSRKARASKAQVIAIWDLDGGPTKKRVVSSDFDVTFIYKVGKVVTPTRPFNPDRWSECAAGIHHFMTFAEAATY